MHDYIIIVQLCVKTTFHKHLQCFNNEDNILAVVAQIMLYH